MKLKVYIAPFSAFKLRKASISWFYSTLKHTLAPPVDRIRNQCVEYVKTWVQKILKPGAPMLKGPEYIDVSSGYFYTPVISYFSVSYIMYALRNRTVQSLCCPCFVFFASFLQLLDSFHPMLRPDTSTRSRCRTKVQSIVQLYTSSVSPKFRLLTQTTQDSLTSDAAERIWNALVNGEMIANDQPSIRFSRPRWILGTRTCYCADIYTTVERWRITWR